MQTNLIYGLIQTPEPAQTARDIGQQIRDQIQAAKDQALAARKGIIIAPGGGAPGTPVIQVPFDPNRGTVPRGAVDLGLGFFFFTAMILIGLPIARAIARKMDRVNSPARLPSDVSTQLAQLSQAVDAIAVEVERISEGQRFTTKLLSEQAANASKTLLAPAGERSPGS